MTEKKNPNYSASAVNLTNPPEIRLKLLELQEAQAKARTLDANLQAMPEYQELKHYILHNELGFTADTVKSEMLNYMTKPPRIIGQFFKFFFLHPTTWVQVIPVSYYKGDIYWDLQKLWGYAIMGLLIGGLIWLI